MVADRFKYTFSQERKATRLLGLIQMVLLVIGSSLAIIAWRTSRWLTLLGAIIAILLFLLFSLYLIVRFRSLPIYKRKSHITAVLNRLLTEELKWNVS